MIRDVFIIVFTGTVVLALLVASLWMFRLYRSACRVAKNLDEISSIILDRVARPLTTLPPLMEVVKYVWELVQQCRSRERRIEDVERE